MRLERNNNFDLLRLFAATTVMIWHGAEHLGVFNKMYYFLACFYHFPGVPIFFTISGFLISYSLERNNFDLRTYFKNRSLRIFPALWLCTLLTAILLFGFGKVTVLKDLFAWLLAQLTFLQFYSPASFKSWGVGHPNGSLWSIAVELQFYLVLPIILLIVSKIKNILLANFFLIVLFLASIVFRYFIDSESLAHSYPFLIKLSGNFILYYLHFFLTGIILYKNFDTIKALITGKVFYWLAIYMLYILIFKMWLGLYENPYSINIFGIIANTLLSFLTLSFAFSFQNLSNKLLNHNDISYGIYIYHMPIVNLMIALNMKGSFTYLLVMMGVSIIMAIVSWKLIEQKILLIFKSK
jgi:peptidoglycan/LPS O-acetylase OafA/YrhL